MIFYINNIIHHTIHNIMWDYYEKKKFLFFFIYYENLHNIPNMVERYFFFFFFLCTIIWILYFKNKKMEYGKNYVAINLLNFLKNHHNMYIVQWLQYTIRVLAYVTLPLPLYFSLYPGKGFFYFCILISRWWYVCWMINVHMACEKLMEWKLVLEELLHFV